MVKIDDFCYMRLGKHLEGLEPNESSLLEPVHLRNSGNERALLLLHGFASTPAVYRYLIPQIKHYDAIVAPALAGHAQSIQDFSLSKAADWVTTASNACEALCKEYKKVDVMGLSLGGLIACELSRRFKLNHLYLLAPAVAVTTHIYFTIKLCQIFRLLGFHHLRNNGGTTLSKVNKEIAYKKLPLSTLIEVLSFINQFQLVAPTCPVDVFLGAHDNVVLSERVQQIFTPLKKTTIHWLNNSSHLLPLDNDMDQIIQVINNCE